MYVVFKGNSSSPNSKGQPIYPEVSSKWTIGFLEVRGKPLFLHNLGISSHQPESHVYLALAEEIYGTCTHIKTWAGLQPAQYHKCLPLHMSMLISWSFSPPYLKLPPAYGLPSPQ